MGSEWHELGGCVYYFWYTSMAAVERGDGSSWLSPGVRVGRSRRKSLLSSKSICDYQNSTALTSFVHNDRALVVHPQATAKAEAVSRPITGTKFYTDRLPAVLQTAHGLTHQRRGHRKLRHYHVSVSASHWRLPIPAVNATSLLTRTQCLCICLWPMQCCPTRQGLRRHAANSKQRRRWRLQLSRGLAFCALLQRRPALHPVRARTLAAAVALRHPS